MTADQSNPDPTGGDIFIGLVRAIGTDLNDVIEALHTSFARAGIGSGSIHTIDLAKEIPTAVHRLCEANGTSSPIDFSGGSRLEYYEAHMDGGDYLRANAGADFMAQIGVARTAAERTMADASTSRRVFIFKSLMHPSEVRLLKAMYSKRFFVIAVYSDASDRRERLVASLRPPIPATPAISFEGKAPDEADIARIESESRERSLLELQVDGLMRRDEGLSEPEEPSHAVPSRRVAIRKTFDLADIFATPHESADARDPNRKGVVERFVEKLFDEPFHTPTRDELGMAHAYVAASCTRP